MKSFPPLFRWLTIAALIDWLIGRTFTRSAMFMPKSPLMIAIYQTLGAIGQVAFTLTGLLALITIVWIVWRERGRPLLALALIISAALSVLFVFVAPIGWWAVLAHALTLIIISAWLARGWHTAAYITEKVAVTVPALALLLSTMYHLLPALTEALNLSTTPPWTSTLFSLGEALVTLSPIGWWWIYRQRLSRKTYLIALIPALALTIFHFVNPAMTSILAIWSIGLTLYLPWPVYAISLWLCGAVVIEAIRRREQIGWALLLLAAGGYVPQFSTHAFLGLIGLWLISQSLLPVGQNLQHFLWLRRIVAPQMHAEIVRAAHITVHHK